MAFEVVGMSADDQAAWQAALGTSIAASVDLSSADILALDSVSKTLVPAPGAGKIVQVDQATIFFSAGVPYTGGGNLLFQYGNSGIGPLYVGVGQSPFLGSDDQFMIAAPDQSAFTVFDNQAFILKASGAFVDGDGTAKVSLSYKIIDAA